MEDEVAYHLLLTFVSRVGKFCEKRGFRDEEEVGESHFCSIQLKSSGGAPTAASTAGNIRRCELRSTRKDMHTVY